MEREIAPFYILVKLFYDKLLGKINGFNVKNGRFDFVAGKPQSNAVFYQKVRNPVGFNCVFSGRLLAACDKIKKGCLTAAVRVLYDTVTRHSFYGEKSCFRKIVV